MTRFEEIGAEIQYRAKSLKQANKAYEKSCAICCEKKGIQINCDRCAIDSAHNIVIATFAN